MAVNKYLLQAAKKSIKQAFVPSQPQAGGAPPMDPSMGGGAPPMDPSMMGAAGGTPPMDPSMMGAAGGAPPMDPSMMAAGGAGAPPMDPSMMGGAPPMDPSMMGGAVAPPQEDIRAVVQEELQKALASIKGGKGSSKKDNGGQVEMFMHRIQKLLTHLYSSLGLNLPHDILDDMPAKSEEPSALSDASQPKTAAYDNISVSEKAEGILHLLRKIK